MGLNYKEMAKYTLFHYFIFFIKYNNHETVGINGIVHGKCSLHAHLHQAQLKEQAKAAVIATTYLLNYR